MQRWPPEPRSRRRRRPSETDSAAPIRWGGPPASRRPCHCPAKRAGLGRGVGFPRALRIGGTSAPLYGLTWLPAPHAVRADEAVDAGREVAGACALLLAPPLGGSPSSALAALAAAFAASSCARASASLSSFALRTTLAAAGVGVADSFLLPGISLTSPEPERIWKVAGFGGCGGCLLGAGLGARAGAGAGVGAGAGAGTSFLVGMMGWDFTIFPGQGVVTRVALPRPRGQGYPLRRFLQGARCPSCFTRAPCAAPRPAARSMGRVDAPVRVRERL